MDILKKLEEKKQIYTRLLDQIRALDMERQRLYEEALRLEGEIRALQELLEEVEKDGLGENIPDKK